MVRKTPIANKTEVSMQHPVNMSSSAVEYREAGTVFGQPCHYGSPEEPGMKLGNTEVMTKSDEETKNLPQNFSSDNSEAPLKPDQQGKTTKDEKVTSAGRQECTEPSAAEYTSLIDTLPNNQEFGNETSNQRNRTLSDDYVSTEDKDLSFGDFGSTKPINEGEDNTSSADAAIVTPRTVEVTDCSSINSCQKQVTDNSGIITGPVLSTGSCRIIFSSPEQVTDTSSLHLSQFYINGNSFSIVRHLLLGATCSDPKECVPAQLKGYPPMMQDIDDPHSNSPSKYSDTCTVDHFCVITIQLIMDPTGSLERLFLESKNFVLSKLIPFFLKMGNKHDNIREVLRCLLPEYLFKHGPFSFYGNDQEIMCSLFKRYSILCLEKLDDPAVTLLLSSTVWVLPPENCELNLSVLQNLVVDAFQYQFKHAPFNPTCLSTEPPPMVIVRFTEENAIPLTRVLRLHGVIKIGRHLYYVGAFSSYHEGHFRARINCYKGEGSHFLYCNSLGFSDDVNYPGELSMVFLFIVPRIQPDGGPSIGK